MAYRDAHFMSGLSSLLAGMMEVGRRKIQDRQMTALNHQYAWFAWITPRRHELPVYKSWQALYARYHLWRICTWVVDEGKVIKDGASASCRPTLEGIVARFDYCPLTMLTYADKRMLTYLWNNMLSSMKGSRMMASREIEEPAGTGLNLRGDVWMSHFMKLIYDTYTNRDTMSTC